jgi:hypothetical protein
MPTFLIDPPQGLYFVLAAALLITGLVWLSRRNRKVRAVFVVVLLLTAIVGLSDLLLESPREAAVRGVKELSAAINARNWDAFDARVSKDFNYKGVLKKPDLRNKMSGVIGMFDARTAVWEFNRDKVNQIDENQVEVVFDAKGDPKAGAAYYAHFKALFAREADGEWRLKSFAVYPYASKTNGQEETIPGVP